MKKIIISKDLTNYIESLQFDVDAMRSVLSYMIRNGVDITGDSFKKYQKEYNEKYIKFQAAKNEISQALCDKTDGTPVNWNLNFSTCEVTYEKI